MKEIDILKNFTKNQLLREAECVEQCGEWLHMPLIGYSPEKLRHLANLKNDSLREEIYENEQDY